MQWARHAAAATQAARILQSNVIWPTPCLLTAAFASPITGRAGPAEAADEGLCADADAAAEVGLPTTDADRATADADPAAAGEADAAGACGAPTLALARRGAGCGSSAAAVASSCSRLLRFNSSSMMTLLAGCARFRAYWPPGLTRSSPATRSVTTRPRVPGGGGGGPTNADAAARALPGTATALLSCSV